MENNVKKSSDDENSDEWIESYESYDSDKEFKNDQLTTKLIKRSKKSNRDLPSKNTYHSSSESDNTSTDEAPKVEAPDDEDKLKSNPAWADAMTKVLKSKKSSGKKAIVLSKAKKIRDVKPKKPKLDFEIVGAVPENENVNLEESEDKKPILGKKCSMKEYQVKGRLKPSVLDKDREKTLMKIATKGVVQLFNAVRQQQKTIDKSLKKVGKSELKREKVLENIDKKKFLDALAGSVKSVPLNSDVKSEEETEEQNDTWSVLRDDFMMGTKLKDWDKKEVV